MANGTTFTYKNPLADSASRPTTYFESANAFSSLGVDDPANPISNNTQANMWTPPLNTSWNWGKDRVCGVNLGRWFMLSTPMAADAANGRLAQLETHYDAFVVSI